MCLDEWGMNKGTSMHTTYDPLCCADLGLRYSKHTSHHCCVMPLVICACCNSNTNLLQQFLQCWWIGFHTVLLHSVERFDTPFSLVFLAPQAYVPLVLLPYPPSSHHTKLSPSHFTLLLTTQFTCCLASAHSASTAPLAC